jgi:hypothetical protein
VCGFKVPVIFLFVPDFSYEQCEHHIAYICILHIFASVFSFASQHFDRPSTCILAHVFPGLQHFDRPFPCTGIVEEELMALPAHLAGPAAAAQRDINAGRPLAYYG